MLRIRRIFKNYDETGSFNEQVNLYALWTRTFSLPRPETWASSSKFRALTTSAWMGTRSTD